MYIYIYIYILYVCARMLSWGVGTNHNLYLYLALLAANHQNEPTLHAQCMRNACALGTQYFVEYSVSSQRAQAGWTRSLSDGSGACKEP